MEEIKVNGALLRDMFIMGAALLEKGKASIDALNVFPVPDGDTGTNMSMTMQSAVREMKNSDASTVGEVAAAVSLGALRGARGNSGVILSQVFRGFSRALAGKEEMDGALFAQALASGSEAAYKAVMKPKEGTMLTVSRLIAQGVSAAADGGANVYKLIDVVLESGEDALKRTPDMLPVLKEAGVVDSGGKGLLTIYRGFKMAIDGEEIDDYVEPETQAEPTLYANGDAMMQMPELGLENVQDIKFGYCTEFFIIHLDDSDDSFVEADLEKFRDKLDRIGDSVVVAYDSGVVKVHVHSNAPGKILQLALRLGEVDKIKVDNMREQNREFAREQKRLERESAVVAVSAGEGIDHVFCELGVSALIQGGQTMNPSTDAILKAVKRANARTVYVLPNNGNIILAAQQAAQISDRNIIVIPSQSVMQGINAAMAFVPDADADTNREAMQQAIDHVISGAVTYAVRDTDYNGHHIEEGNIMGLMENNIVEVGQSVEETSEQLLKDMIAQQPEDTVITVFYGEEVQEEQAEALVEKMRLKYPDAEFTLQYGGQQLYYYYFSVE